MQRLRADDLGSVLQHPAALAARDAATLESNATHADAEDPWNDRHFYEASTAAASHHPTQPSPATYMAEPAVTLAAKLQASPTARTTRRNVILILLAVVIVLAAIGLAWYLWTSSGSTAMANERPTAFTPLQRVRNLWANKAAKSPSRSVDTPVTGSAAQDESDTPPLRHPRRIMLEPQPPPSQMPPPPPSRAPTRSVTFAPDVERIYYSDEDSASEVSSSSAPLPLTPPANVLPGSETRGRPEMARSVAVDANVDHLYAHVGGGGSGGGNKVLGGSETVRALQQAGAGGISAEQLERSAYDPDTDPTRDPYANARRSMGSLYEKEMAGRQHDSGADDDVTLDELGIHSADDEYAASRQRSKVMAQASAAAVGRIYDTVQRQRGGAKDVPFVNPDAGIDYINVHTQQPLSAMTE